MQLSGLVLPFAGSTPPDGWLLCDGSAVSRTTHADLFDVIGTTYGAGDGATTFNLPDLRGRVLAGLDNMGGTSANRVTDVQADSLGGSKGSETHTLSTSEMPGHTHTGPSHSHSITFASDAGDGFAAIKGTSSSTNISTTNTGGSGTGNTGSTGSGSAHENMQPTMFMNYIIKT